METRSRYTPLSSKDAWERLLAGSKNLSRLERLSDERLGDAEARQVSMAVDILNMEQPSGKQKRYKEFLYDVLSNSSPPFVLLSAIALGQARVASMTISNRSSLISKIKDNKDNTDMNHNTVQSLAIKYLIPESVADLPPPQNTEVKPSGKRKRMADPQYSEQTSESAIRHHSDAYEATVSTAPPAPGPAAAYIGDIYELTPEDAIAVMSDICGPIWLTNPYDGNTQPFVNIPISWKLLDHFISRRIM